ncbi:MAG: phenylacetate--CoA ligase [Lachnospiraceae bacterium]|nr:phenylacetate--CoA ligase [Lachnospiraceae bacterium]MBQ2117419.1 phenylacetate--CoA ligase [Lachnospiraceae bacterium]MBQ2406094.1 phenylacetate--CoA ligase [Lachnospiraceae bacterium]MEE0919081.1 phenylacetate--CoA ligase [Lachnospiraceae bacterium]
MIWNEARECISRDELMELQGRCLVKLVNTMYYNVEYYRKKMQKEGLEPGDIKGIDDLYKLPFTTQEDLRNNSPYNILAVPKSEIIRYQATSETTGEGKMVGYTRNDIEIWSECVARCIYMAGLNRNDTIQVAYNYGLFTGGIGAHYGVEKVGASVVPISLCNTNKMLKLMQNLEVTGIMCTPSYLMHVSDEIAGCGDKIKLKVAICGSESWPDEMRVEIENKLGIKAFDIYGMTEIAGPGVAGDCEYHAGMHIQEDFFISEVIDTETLEKVPDGVEGELVFTTLLKEGTPLIRYRSNDISSITHEKCQCGRTFARIDKPYRKTDDMFVVRGVSVYPQKIAAAFDKIEYENVRFMLKAERIKGIDELKLLIEFERDYNFAEHKDIESLFEDAKTAIKKSAGVIPQIEVVPAGSIKLGSNKKIVVIDSRKYN